MYEKGVTCGFCYQDQQSLNTIRYVEIEGKEIGVCWKCAEAESIISEGLDMDDKGILKNNEYVPAKTAREKLQLLILKGWK